MTNPNPLTDNELQAAAYFAVGVTSEGSIAGRDVAYRLSFAGNVGAGGRMEPVANSGYSLGTLQIDLGQHPDVARDLLDSYQAWAIPTSPSIIQNMATSALIPHRAAIRLPLAALRPEAKPTPLLKARKCTCSSDLPCRTSMA